jgi:hypothetical protein
VETEQERELRDLQEERFKLTELQKAPGYQWLLEIAGAQVEARKQAVFLRPLETMDGVLGQEYAKGEIAGIELFRKLVDIRINDLTDEIMRRTEDEPVDS